jgi:8-oxo-dGTP pyrophosphatase MutT (NUDIX family)
MSTVIPFKENVVRNMAIERARPGASKRLKDVDECGIILFNQDFSKLLLVYDTYEAEWGIPKGRLNAEERKHRRYYDCACRAMLEETGVCVRRHRDTYKKLDGNASTLITPYHELLFVLVTDSARAFPERTRWFDTDALYAFTASSYCSTILRVLVGSYLLRQ